MIKQVCQLDAQGYFIGTVMADPNPRVPGEFLLPAGTVDVPPPVVPVNFRALWTGFGWELEGMPAEPPGSVEPPEDLSDTERLIQRYTRALEANYDTVAQQRRYDNRFTCALRAGYPGPFQAEGIAFAQWMDSCNALGYQVMAEVIDGVRPLPTIEELLAMMPAMVWPGAVA